MKLINIDIYFMDGKKETVELIASPFCESYKNVEGLIKWPLKGDYHFMGEELDHLVQRLVDNGYLKEKYDPMPFLALSYDCPVWL